MREIRSFCAELFTSCSLILTKLIQKNKKSVTVSGNFPKLIPRNYESVTFGQFEEGGGRTPTGPSVTVTFINSKGIINR